MSLVHAEYLKMTRRKLYPTMLAILGFFTVVAAFILLLFAQIAPEIAGDIPSVPKPEAYVFGAQQIAGQTWFPLILAVVMLGGELSTTVWATSLTRDSRRLAHIAARLLIFGIASWIAFLLGMALWSGIAAFAAEGSGTLGIGDWIGLVWKMGLISLAWTALGLGTVGALRSIGPAIGAVLAFSFLESLLALWDPYGNVALTAGTTALFEVSLGGIAGSFLPGADLSLAHAIAIILGWTLVGLGLSWWGLHRRDA
jgi:hypothetical protein